MRSVSVCCLGSLHGLHSACLVLSSSNGQFDSSPEGVCLRRWQCKFHIASSLQYPNTSFGQKPVPKCGPQLRILHTISEFSYSKKPGEGQGECYLSNNSFVVPVWQVLKDAEEVWPGKQGAYAALMFTVVGFYSLNGFFEAGL